MQVDPHEYDCDEELQDAVNRMSTVCQSFYDAHHSHHELADEHEEGGPSDGE